MPPRLQKPGTRVPRVLAPQEDEGLSNDPYSSSIGPAPTNSWHKSIVDFLDDPTAGLRNWLREQSPNASDEYGNDRWLPSDMLGLFSENFQGKGDAAPGAPGHIPAAEAVSIVPKVYWPKRIDMLVDQMRRDVPYLQDVRRGEKFVGDTANFLDLHKPIAAHVNDIKLLPVAEAERRIGQAKGNYNSGMSYGRQFRADDLDRVKFQAGEDRYGFSGDNPNPYYTDSQFENNNKKYRAILDNRINLKESPEWGTLNQFDTLRHELTHAAQDIGFSHKYEQMLKDYDSSHPEYWTNPIEIGARASDQKGLRDYQRIIGGPVDSPVPTIERYLEEAKVGANAMLLKNEGSGRNFLNRFNEVAIPQINRGLKSSRAITGTVLSPKEAKIVPEIPDYFNKNRNSWNISQNNDMSPWNKYSIILGLMGKE